MNSKLLLIGFFLVVPMQMVMAMERSTEKDLSVPMDTLILLLTVKQTAEESSWCGLFPWKTNKPVAELADKILKGALNEGLSENPRAEIVKFIREQEVLDDGWCCNDQGQCPRLEKALGAPRAIVMEAKKDR
jgi:hypothetical protein